MKRRKIIAAIVLLGGIALFFVIIGASSSSNAPLVTAKTGAGADGSLDYTVSANRGPMNNGGTASGTAAVTDNLTDLLTQNYAQTVFQMNSGFAGASATGSNPISFPSVDETSQLLSQAINQKLQYKTYAPEDILTSDDVSTTSQLQYLAAVGAITQKDFGSFKTPMDKMVSNFFNNNDTSALNQYIAIANQEVVDLLALRAPNNWAAWHLSNINLWEEKITVFSAIADLANDPAKAVIGLNQINDILNENLTVQQTMQAQYQSLAS